MNKPDQEIDQIFQSRLRDAAVPPPAFVWLAVEKELRGRKRRPFAWWWAGAFMVGTVATLWYLSQPGSIEPVNTAVASNQSGMVAGQVTPSADQQQRATIAASESTLNNTPQDKKASAGSVVKNIAAAEVQQTKVQHIYYSKNSSLSADLAAPVLSKTVNGGSAAAPIEAFIPATETADPANITTTNNVIPSGLTSFSPLSTATPDFLTIQSSKPSLRTWPVKIVKKHKDKNENCFDFASHRNALLLEAFTGPITASKSLTTVHSSENNEYLAKRQSTEGRGWGFNGGLRATYLFQEHFSVSAGVQYDQFTEVFTYTELVSIDTTYIIHTNPQTGETTKEIKDVDLGYERTRAYNRFGFLDIPVSLGYEMRHGRYGLRVQGGPSLNLLFYKRGMIINPETGKPMPVTQDGASTVYSSHAGLSVQGSVQCFWSLRPSTRVFAEPYYRKMLHPVTLSSHPIMQQYGIWGVKLGLTKIF